MRKSLTILAAAAASLTLVATGPVDANRPERGDQIMVLNQDPDTGEFGLFGCTEIAWFGTIDLAGTTYGMALYPLPGGKFTGQGTIQHYEEAWKIFDGTFSLSDSGTLESCEPGPIVLAGVDSGTGSFVNDKFRSTGTVDDAYEPFTEWLGRHVYQDGDIGPIEYQGEPFIGFYGNMRLH